MNTIDLLWAMFGTMAGSTLVTAFMWLLTAVCVRDVERWIEQVSCRKRHTIVTVPSFGLMAAAFAVTAIGLLVTATWAGELERESTAHITRRDRHTVLIGSSFVLTAVGIVMTAVGWLATVTWVRELEREMEQITGRNRHAILLGLSSGMMAVGTVVTVIVWIATGMWVRELEPGMDLIDRPHRHTILFVSFLVGIASTTIGWLVTFQILGVLEEITCLYRHTNIAAVPAANVHDDRRVCPLPPTSSTSVSTGIV